MTQVDVTLVQPGDFVTCDRRRSSAIAVTSGRRMLLLFESPGYHGRAVQTGPLSDDLDEVWREAC